MSLLTRIPSGWLTWLGPLLAGLLLWLSFPPIGWTGLIFVAFIPLLWHQEIAWRYAMGGRRTAFFWPLFSGLFLWNLLCTGWIRNASWEGAAMAILLSSFLMTVPWLCAHYVRLRLGSRAFFFAWVCLWMGYEWLQHHYELEWPWLALGNAFSVQTNWVQWYEFSGVGGGTLWVLLANYLGFSLLKQAQAVPFLSRAPGTYRPLFKALFWWLAVLIMPILWSAQVGKKYSDPSFPRATIRVVQPNVDPYEEKFGPGAQEMALRTLMELSDRDSAKVDLLVWPETALPDGFYEENAAQEGQILYIRAWMARAGHRHLLTGLTSFRNYATEETVTARHYGDGTCCYDVFNTALLLDETGPLDWYHKSKLVVGVEKMPWPRYMGFLERFSLDLGGATGSMGSQAERTVLYTRDGLGLAPVICYESVFGEFVTEYVRNGAQLIAIITNDGWWGNTAGHQQHFAYARLRAIECRRAIARSANTGISGFIDLRGNVQSATAYDVPAVQEAGLDLNDSLTFYVRHGDFLGRSLGVLALFILLYAWVSRYREL